jgi:hypothetical protein
MKLKIWSQILALILIIALFYGCAGSTSEDQESSETGITVAVNDDDSGLTPGTVINAPEEVPNDGLANLTLSITDAPIDDAVSVKVTFNRIEIKEGACGVEAECDATGDACGYTEYFAADDEQGPVTINLLDFQNGSSFFFDTVPVATGEYCQVRIYLSDATGDNTITLTGTTEEIDLEINAAIHNNGLKLVSGFEIIDDEPTSLTIDFDVRTSIVVKGGKNPRYGLKPTLRIIQTSDSGNITLDDNVVTEVDEVYYLYTQGYDITDQALTTFIDDQGTLDDTSDDTEELMPYLDAVSSSISAEVDDAITAVFSFVPFGIYDIYKYDEDSTTDGLSMVSANVKLGVVSEP